MKVHSVLFFILSFLAIENIASILKFTNVRCESLNETLVTVQQCRLRAVRRGVTVLNLKVQVKYPIEKLILEAAILKRANGYKPFLINVKIDYCEYVKRKNNPFINLIYKQLQHYTTPNHTCPIMGEIYIKDFYLQTELLNNLPWPTGEYAFREKWHANGKNVLLTDFYFERVEDLIHE